MIADPAISHKMTSSATARGAVAHGGLRQVRDDPRKSNRFKSRPSCCEELGAGAVQTIPIVAGPAA